VKLGLDYAIDHKPGQPDTYQFQLGHVPEDMLMCLLIDASATLGARHNVHATEVLLRLVQRFYEFTAEDAARNN
jgi:hypothetical protein